MRLLFTCRKKKKVKGKRGLRGKENAAIVFMMHLGFRVHPNVRVSDPDVRVSTPPTDQINNK